MPKQTSIPSLESLDPGTLLTQAQAAHYLGKSTSWLEKDRQHGKHGISFHKIGHNVRYKVQDLLDFLNRSRRQFWRPDDEPYV
ncbi:helix-turn-helix domain-containing protein [Ponticaulis sp.]|uniref:helix-turn-helix domain-containing protein n=1 Tax=Ponticaulis sp. TaxID=2020902 RepID=UPI0025DAABA0|nr:helix-turn-helix domain-containing protein [Ponticaulis sp.]